MGNANRVLEARMRFSGLTIILPTLNEEKNIRGVVGKLRGLYPGARIIVADDGSGDRTVKFSRECGADVLDRKGEKIKGITASVLHALGKVETEFFVVMDADSQHPPEKVAELFAALETGAGMAIAYRDSVPGWAMHRRLVSMGAQGLGKARLMLFGNPVPRDVLSGFFGGRAGLAREIAGRNRSRFVGEGYKALFDFLKGVGRGEIEIAEIPYKFGMRNGGNSKMGLRHFACFLKSLLC